MKKSHFYWLGFLSSGQGPVRGQRVLKHKVTVSRGYELGSDGAHGPAGLMRGRETVSEVFPEIPGGVLRAVVLDIRRAKAWGAGLVVDVG